MVSMPRIIAMRAAAAFGSGTGGPTAMSSASAAPLLSSPVVVAMRAATNVSSGAGRSAAEYHASAALLPFLPFALVERAESTIWPPARADHAGVDFRRRSTAGRTPSRLRAHLIES